MRKYKINILLILLLLIILPPVIIGEILYSTSRNRNYIDLPLTSNIIEVKDSPEIQTWYSNQSDTLLIVVHGHGDHSSILYERSKNVFISDKFDVLYMDMRNHGRSGKKTPVSMGLYEKNDISAVLDWVNSKHWQNVYIFGTSMGGVASLFAVDSYNNTQKIKGLILDSFIIDPVDAIDRNLKKDYVINPWRWLTINYIFQMRARNWHYPDILKVLDRIDIPVIIFQGSEDVVAPSSVLKHVDKLNKTNVETVLIKDGTHSKLFDFLTFQSKFDEFIKI